MPDTVVRLGGCSNALRLAEMFHTIFVEQPNRLQLRPEVQYMKFVLHHFQDVARRKSLPIEGEVLILYRSRQNALHHHLRGLLEKMIVIKPLTGGT